MAAWGVGARIWVPHEGGWAQAVVTAYEGSQIRVRRDFDADEIQLEGTQAFLCNADDVEDMTSLAFLHEPGVLWNLQSRYQKCEIYTYTGSILIAVNPFKPLPHLYGTNVIDRYRTSPREQLPPHVYATACAAYRNMMRDGAGQAILVTGESGAGKTETAKLIMACLTHLGALHSLRSSGGGARRISGVEQKILDSNPLLEAFGNAKTLRNNNSSRFGKYVEIFFDPAAGGAVTGAAVRTYLLERSRVVAVNNPERSFHIFYQLVYGASPEDRAAWRLPDSAAGFASLARSSCVELPGQSNEEEYQHTRRAMSHIGLSEEQQSAVLATVAAVLHLGNIAFVDAEAVAGGGGSSGRAEGAVVPSGAGRAALEAAAELLGVEPGPLEEALTTRQIQTPEGPIATPLSAQAAADARDSMAKVVYARLFDWLVAAINAAVDEAHNGGGGGGPSSGHLSIGLLDIYGFESFEVNDLEQLCINLTNEKLQQHFNQHVFKWEQAEYEREGVDWSYISFRDNADVLELLEGRMGIMDLLDETCRFPKATADDLAHKYGSSPSVSGSSRFTRLKRPATSFTVEHYAGAVTYSTLNFLDKNRDYVVAEHQALLGRSRWPLIQELFAPESPADGVAGANGAAPAGRQSQFQFRSVSTQCRRQLTELMAALSRLQPHYVRCIKPNPGGVPGEFNSQYSLQQLRCGGVMEAVRIACAGFAYRRPYAAFLEHFWQLCPGPIHELRRRVAAQQPRQQPPPAASQQQPLPAAGPAGSAVEASSLASLDVGQLRAAAQAVLEAARLPAHSMGGHGGPALAGGGEGPPARYLGHTKVFLRASATAMLERQRLESTNAAAARIQAHYRRLQLQRRYQAMRLAAVTMQARCRAWLARREAEQRRRERAALAIQRAWRGCVHRLRFERLRRAALVVQAMWRGVLTRRCIEDTRRERAALIFQTAWRGAAVRREYLGVLRFWRAAVKVQAAWRGYAARALYKQILPLHRAALTLQRIWRSRRYGQGSKRAERLRSVLLQFWVYTKAAVVIQAAWRGKVARQLVRKMRLQQRRARFLALASGFSLEGAAGGQLGGHLPARLSPDMLRRSVIHTPPSGPRAYCHALGGSGGKVFSGPLHTPARSADTTPVAGDVVRANDLASDRDSRMRSRLLELQDFKVSPLVQYWQHREAAAAGSSQPRGQRRGGSGPGGPIASRSRPGTAEVSRSQQRGRAGASPVRFLRSPYGAVTPPVPRLLPDTDDRMVPGGGHGNSTVTTLDDATEVGSRGASSTSFEDGTSMGSHGGSAVEEVVELSSNGGLSCEPSYGQLLSYGGRQEECEEHVDP